MKHNNHNIFKNILFAIILLFLFLPELQQRLNFIDVPPLKGYYAAIEDSTFSVEGWLEGTYQEQKQKYFNENFGFRNFCVRLNNQIAYSLFNHTNANGVIVGKDNYLYEKAYIKTYFGEDFIGKDSINKKIKKFKLIRDTLSSKGIDLIIVFAPGKGTFYPEYIPEDYYRKKKSITNYSYYLSEVKKNKINYIDFNDWFLQMKDTSAYPLIPKTGIHWSKYGAFLAADSIIKYIQSLRKINMSQIKIENIELSDTARNNDNDIELGMNLLFDIPNLTMACPSFTIINDSNTIHPKVLTVADSYYWGMFNLGMSTQVFNDSEFWYYNKQIYPDSYKQPLYVGDIDIIKKVEGNDVIILMATDANLHKFSFGFINQLYEAYFNNQSNTERSIEFYINVIKKDPEWMEIVKTQALKNNIPIEDAIRGNAEYVVWKNKNK